MRACARLRAVLRFARSLDSSCARRVGRGESRARCAVQTREISMLRIYPILLDLVRTVGPLVRELERCDPDLARQCRRALCSAPLNVAEGSYSRGKNRAARYHTALGSLREVLACFEVAAALGYVSDIEPALKRCFDHVLGTLVRLTGGH